MIDEVIIKKIIKEIQSQKIYEKDFNAIVKQFKKKLKNVNFERNSFVAKDFFGAKCGLARAREKLLLEQKIRKDWLVDYKNKKGKNIIDFQGLYIFLLNNKPFYIGISQKVISRILNHLKGHSHNNSSLAFSLSKLYHKHKTGNAYIGRRKELAFKDLQEFLMESKLIFFPIKDENELYLFEVYCSMEYKTMLNSFHTH